MKKFASVILAVLIAFSMFSFVVSAAGVQFTVNADKTTVKAGDVVTVTVSIPENAGLATVQVALKYDAEAFKVNGIVGGGIFGFEEVNAAHADGAFYTAAASTPPTKGGTLFTVTLEALKATDSELSLVFSEATDANFENVEVTANTVAIKGEVVEEPSEDPDPECKHETMSKWAVTKVATCKKDGVETRNCTVCDYSETRAIPATGKCTYKWVVTKEATATQYGEKQLKCTMCGDVKETQKLAVKGEDSLTNPSIPNTDAIA